MCKVTTSVQLFTESNRELKNPNRGLYSLYPFAITDEEEAYVAKVAEYCAWSPDTTLALVEINLQSYQAGEISEAGLSNIDALLNAWGQSGKRLIIRFLYDWDGESGLHEPESMDIILRHMAQLGPLLQRHKDMIFTLQGLFVGSWGEMHPRPDIRAGPGARRAPPGPVAHEHPPGRGPSAVRPPGPVQRRHVGK